MSMKIVDTHIHFLVVIIPQTEVGCVGMYGKSISYNERKRMYISYSMGYNALCFLFQCTYVMFTM